MARRPRHLFLSGRNRLGPPSPKSGCQPCRLPLSRAARGNPRADPRILAALLAGKNLDEVAKEQRLSRKRVEKVLRDELHRRWAPRPKTMRVCRSHGSNE